MQKSRQINAHVYGKINIFSVKSTVSEEVAKELISRKILERDRVSVWKKM